MKLFFRLTVISLLLILISACSSDGETLAPGSDGLGTGVTNEVVLTLDNTDVNTFDIDSFTQDISQATGADLDQIVITSVNGFTRSGVYVSFYFEDSEEGGLSAGDCLENIQLATAEGTLGSYDVTIIITNTDNTFNCLSATDCAGICNGSTEEDECGTCNGNGPPENYDCDGNCLIDSDCLGNCGGNAEYDICGVCNGNGSSCDIGQIVGTYYATRVSVYENNDCSGLAFNTFNGPNFYNSYIYDIVTIRRRKKRQNSKFYKKFT